MSESLPIIKSEIQQVFRGSVIGIWSLGILLPCQNLHLWGSFTVPLTSCLTGLDQSVLQIKTKIFSCRTADSKPVKQEVNSTVIFLPLVFLGLFLLNPCRQGQELILEGSRRTKLSTLVGSSLTDKYKVKEVFLKGKDQYC